MVQSPTASAEAPIGHPGTYFVVVIDYGRKGREAIVDPEITRREVISRIASGEYKNISFIHEITMGELPKDVTDEFLHCAKWGDHMEAAE